MANKKIENRLKLLIVFAILFLSVAAYAGIPNTFTGSTTISSSAVNANFTYNLRAVGSVEASLLTFAQYKTAVGDPGTFDAATSKWAPADGRDVTGSGYNTVTSRTVVPDLRGMFLRGLNTIDGGTRADGNQDPDAATRTGGNVVGSYQVDDFKSHIHTEQQRVIGGVFWNAGGSNGADGGPTRNTTDPTGGNETRPKNVAVYYYVRIN